MSIPDALRRPGIRWDNIRYPMEVVAIARGSEIYAGRPFVWPNLTRSLADVQHPSKPDGGDDRHPFAGKDD